MSSYLAQEVHLARRHEEILSQRSVLLQQMETYLGDKKTKKTWQTQAADAARKRNAALLNLGESEPEPILVCLSTGMAADGSVPTGLCAPKALPACEAWQPHQRDQVLLLDHSGLGVFKSQQGPHLTQSPSATKASEKMLKGRLQFSCLAVGSSRSSRRSDGAMRCFVAENQTREMSLLPGLRWCTSSF
eukprot:XP_021122462.1 uncharacterized protein C3orf14 homolog isoform X1 [Anas platyrhynchos]